MIEETIHIHDKYQFEIKLGYQFRGEKETTAYDVETYLFFPNSLKISRHTYSKTDFYNDIQVYIRFKTPTVLLKDIVRGMQSPFAKLNKSVERLLSQLNETTISHYEYHVKMFCCIFKSAIRDHVSFIVTKEDPVDIEDLLSNYLTSIQSIIREFRTIRSQMNVPTIEKKLFSIYLFGDEYLSVLIESYSYDLLEHLETIIFPAKDQYKAKLLGLISSELTYRQKHGYPSLPDAHSTNEEFIFRTSVLKKYMGSVLFLNTRMKREGEWLEQLAFALAAGVAMMFATGIAYMAQMEYTSLSFPLFMILVISYMFKDRIKEITRGYLGNKLRHVLFDHKTDIQAGPKEKIGWCKESFTFLDERRLPKHILKLRDRDHITEIENGWVGETTILYRKRIKLFRKHLERLYYDYPVESINDIMRLNVSKFLSKMDNPKKPVYVPDGDSYQRVHGRRVYHVNMILKYSTRTRVVYRRFRIVLSRSGIKRIEEVVFDEEAR